MYEYPCSVVTWSRVNVTLPGVDIRDRFSTVPEAGYADLPPGIGFEPKDEPLRRGFDLLGRVLGRVLIGQQGQDLFERGRDPTPPLSPPHRLKLPVVSLPCESQTYIPTMARFPAIPAIRTRDHRGDRSRK